MKKTTPKKIRLSRETLGKLTDEQLKGADGGQRPVHWTSDSEEACCV